MNLDDFPKRDKNHTIESKADAAFQSFIANSDEFFIQGSDKRDYGTDYHIEVGPAGSATNVRVQVQLKGTEKDLNADGSLSIEVRRANLNYLLMQPYSLYVCYHVPTKSLRLSFAESVAKNYEHSGKSWSDQESITVVFSDELTAERLASLAALAKANTSALRISRVVQAVAPSAEVPRILKAAAPELHLPADGEQAAEILSKLYESGADNVISGAFDKFAAILGKDHDAMVFCYMAETNLSMSSKPLHPERIWQGLGYFRSKLETGRIYVGSLLYNIGNGFTALGKEDAAIKSYEEAIKHLTSSDMIGLLAQCNKNLGTSFEKIGEGEKAVGFYREALRLDPQLVEAHYALGTWCHRAGQYEDALNHFDQVVFLKTMIEKALGVSGWRVNILFNLGEGRSAFRELNSLLSHAEAYTWIWPWCARQVVNFGRASPVNARLSVEFWKRFLENFPSDRIGQRELLLAQLQLRMEGHAIGVTYDQFKDGFVAVIEHLDPEAVPLLWDRLGHWAQDEGNWEDAVWCFRKAYELEGRLTGYCLAVALNALGRYDESLPLLKQQAEEIQPDAMSWNQLATAHEFLGQFPEAIAAYEKTITLDPDFATAWFNLGGLHWNNGNDAESRKIWTEAVARFPDHELTLILRRDLPMAVG